MTLRRPRPHDAPRLDMTPMIDVTFLLLVFFLCTLRLKTLDGKLEAWLPRDVGPTAEPTAPVEPVRVRLAVLEPGSAPAPGRAPQGRVLDYRVGPRRVPSLAALERRLVELHRADATRPLVVEATAPAGAPERALVTQGEVVAVVDRGVSAGYTEVRFAAPGP